MLTLNEFAARQVFHRLKDQDGNPVYWTVVAGGGEGYLMVWPNGDTFHTYREPTEHHGFERWEWDA